MSGRRRPELTLSKVRSSLTNGSTILPGDVDHRTAMMRRLRDLIYEHQNDLGGDDVLSSAERNLIHRSSMLTVQLEMMEARWVEHHDGVAPRLQLETFQRVTNTIRRTCEALGLPRRAKDITVDVTAQVVQALRGL